MSATATAVLPFRPPTRAPEWHPPAAPAEDARPWSCAPTPGRTSSSTGPGGTPPPPPRSGPCSAPSPVPSSTSGAGPAAWWSAWPGAGVPALGVDSSPAALALARRRGAAVLEADIFGPLPSEGRWATCLLFDGTIGIGGDPTRLLSRCRELTGSGGRVLAEVEPPGTGWRHLVAWFERDGGRGPSFDWAVVGADAVADIARPAGFEVASLDQTPSGRWFADLRARPSSVAARVA